MPFQTRNYQLPKAGTPLLCPAPYSQGSLSTVLGTYSALRRPLWGEGMNEQWKSRQGGKQCQGIGGKSLSSRSSLCLNGLTKQPCLLPRSAFPGATGVCCCLFLHLPNGTRAGEWSAGKLSDRSLWLFWHNWKYPAYHRRTCFWKCSVFTWPWVTPKTQRTVAAHSRTSSTPTAPPRDLESVRRAVL